MRMSQSAARHGDDQGARERAAGQVSDVMLNLEWTVASAKKGHKLVAKDGVDRNAELALAELAKELERLRKRLLQDTYFAVGDRLL